MSLSPPCANVSLESKGHGYLLDFDDLLGAESDADNLYTCANAHPSTIAPRQYRYTTVATVAKDGVDSTLRDVAIGMTVAGTWVTGKPGRDTSSLTANEACVAGEILACARATWMAEAPGLAVLLLADCPQLLVDRLKRANTSAAAMTATITRAQRTPRDHADFDFDNASFPIAPWLANSAANGAAIDARCFWKPYQRLGGNYKKTHSLFRALVDRYGSRRWFLKIDADAILRPTNMLHFLTYLDRHTAAERGGPAHEAPVYFGSHRGATRCKPHDQTNICFAHIFKRALGKGKPGTVALRDTSAWRALERMLPIGDGPDGNFTGNVTPRVTYAWGASYGMSREAASRLVRTKCIMRVGSINCPKCAYSVRGIGMHTWEDAAVGLCMHLLAARLMQVRSLLPFSCTLRFVLHNLSHRCLHIVSLCLRTCAVRMLPLWACLPPPWRHPLDGIRRAATAL